MNIRGFLAAVALMAVMVLPGTASAESIAYAAPGTTNVRGGPGTFYPVIARVRGGMEVIVIQCPGSWCAVTLPDGLDGWIAASRLRMTYASAPVYQRRVVVPSYAYDYPPDYGYFAGPTISFGFFGDNRRSRHRDWDNHGGWNNHDGGENGDWRRRRGGDNDDMQDNAGRSRNNCYGREDDCVVR